MNSSTGKENLSCSDSCFDFTYYVDFDNGSLEYDRCISEESCYLVNASTWLGPLELVGPVYGWVMPFLMLVTFVSNTLIIIVLSKSSMRSPTNTVLLSMAVCDLLSILLPCPWYIYFYMFDGHMDVDWSLGSCYLYELSMETTPQIFHTASNWLTLTLAVQRYIFVCHPSSAKELCTVRSARHVVAGVMAGAVVHMIPRMTDRQYFISSMDTSDGSQHLCFVSLAFVHEHIGIDRYFFVFFWFRVIFVHLIPCTSLVILNYHLCVALRRAEQRRKRLLSKKMKKKSESSLHPGPPAVEAEPRSLIGEGEAEPLALARTASRDRETWNNEAKRRGSFHVIREGRKRKWNLDSHNTTLMLVIVIGLFLMTEIPLLVITILHTLDNCFQLNLMDYNVAQKLVLIINVLICASYPFNFAIYCGMSKQFRNTFSKIFLTSFCDGKYTSDPLLNSNRSSEKSAHFERSHPGSNQRGDRPRVNKS